VSDAALWRHVAVLLERAARVAADPTAGWPLRGRAATLCRVLAFHVHEDEALCAGAMHGAASCIATFPVAHDLLIAALELAPDPSRVVTPLLRLCSRAHELGYHDTVVVALVSLVQIDAFDGNAPPAWLAKTSMIEGEVEYWLRRLLRRWVARFGAQHDGLRAIIRTREDWFLTRRFPMAEMRLMHAEEPTATGWKAIAMRRHELEAGELGIAFGEQHAQAVATLREALERRIDAGSQIALERWLAELTN
jgi:hypothetical protein